MWAGRPALPQKTDHQPLGALKASKQQGEGSGSQGRDFDRIDAGEVGTGDIGEVLVTDHEHGLQWRSSQRRQDAADELGTGLLERVAADRLRSDDCALGTPPSFLALKESAQSSSAGGLVCLENWDLRKDPAQLDEALLTAIGENGVPKARHDEETANHLEEFGIQCGIVMPHESAIHIPQENPHPMPFYEGSIDFPDTLELDRRPQLPDQPPQLGDCLPSRSPPIRGSHAGP